MNLTYTCKFCNARRTIEEEIDPNCPPLALEKWTKLLACNRCADFETERRSCERLAFAQANALENCRTALQPGSARLAEIEIKAKHNFEKILQRYMKAVCKYSHREFQIRCLAGLVIEVMGQPSNAVKVMRHFASNLDHFL